MKYIDVAILTALRSNGVSISISGIDFSAFQSSFFFLIFYKNYDWLILNNFIIRLKTLILSVHSSTIDR